MQKILQIKIQTWKVFILSIELKYNLNLNKVFAIYIWVSIYNIYIKFQTYISFQTLKVKQRLHWYINNNNEINLEI